MNSAHLTHFILACLIACSTIAMEQQPTKEEQLCSAIQQRDVERVKSLIEQKAKLDAEYTEGSRPLMVAVMYHDTAARFPYWSLSDDKDLANQEREELLKRYEKELVIIDTLLKNGADANVQFGVSNNGTNASGMLLNLYKGCTPLMMAIPQATEDHHGIVELLLPYSDMSLKNAKNESALILAINCHSHNSRIAQLVEKYHNHFFANKALIINNGIVKRKLNIKSKVYRSWIKKQQLMSWPNTSNLHIPLKTNAADKNKNTTQNR